MRQALNAGVHCFNVESVGELELLNQVAEEVGATANISIRVNPDIDAKTHPYISTGLKENKFGIDINNALAVYQQAHKMPHLSIIGVDCHIGSQLTELEPFIAALGRVLILVDELSAAGIEIEHLDIGGGLGVQYQDEVPPSHKEYVEAMLAQLKGRKLTVIIEPGRSVAANAGFLLTELLYTKETQEKNFAIVDAAMNDMIRPALYQAWMHVNTAEKRDHSQAPSYDLVGPVCETGDFLAKDRQLHLKPHDILCLQGAGAYGFVMSSNYNTRPRAAEIMIDGNQCHLIRERETIDDLLRGESMLEI